MLPRNEPVVAEVQDEPSNTPVERIVGLHPLVAAGQRTRSADKEPS